MLVSRCLDLPGWCSDPSVVLLCFVSFLTSPHAVEKNTRIRDQRGEFQRATRGRRMQYLGAGCSRVNVTPSFAETKACSKRGKVWLNNNAQTLELKDRSVRSPVFARALFALIFSDPVSFTFKPRRYEVKTERLHGVSLPLLCRETSCLVHTF